MASIMARRIKAESGLFKARAVSRALPRFEADIGIAPMSESQAFQAGLRAGFDLGFNHPKTWAQRLGTVQAPALDLQALRAWADGLKAGAVRGAAEGRAVIVADAEAQALIEAEADAQALTSLAQLDMETLHAWAPAGKRAAWALVERQGVLAHRWP